MKTVRALLERHREDVDDLIGGNGGLRLAEPGLDLRRRGENGGRCQRFHPIPLRIEVNDYAIAEPIGRNDLHHAAFSQKSEREWDIGDAGKFRQKFVTIDLYNILKS